MIDNGTVLTGKLHDISATGCYIEIAKPAVISGECKIIIVISWQESSLKIDDIPGKITRYDESGTAIRFKKPFERIALVPFYAPKVRLTNDDHL